MSPKNARGIGDKLMEVIRVVRFRVALHFTGAILLFATFNLLVFFPYKEYSSFRIGPIHTPDFQPFPLLLLTVFWAINWSFLRKRDGAEQSE